MAIKVQPNFSIGELDPAMHEHTTLDIYKKALATGRNIIVSKSGRALSRPGRKHVVECKTDGRKVRIHSMPHLGAFLEWGHLYVRGYDWLGVQLFDTVHALTEASLDFIKFTDVEISHVMITIDGSIPLVLSIGSGNFVTGKFDAVAAPTLSGTITVAGTGYNVEYAVTSISNGIESLPLETEDSTPKFPINITESNIISATLDTDAGRNYTEMKVYRRPTGGGAFGYVGSATGSDIDGSDVGTFIDIGAAADFSHSPPRLNPTLFDNALTNAEDFDPKTAIRYQQRTLMADGENIEASRVGFPYNFYRDFPYSDDSSLSFKAGSNQSRVLHMMDNNGIVVFTSRGVFTGRGALTLNNLALEKIGDWILDEVVEPLSVLDTILFIDASTNTVRQLVFSTERGGHIARELSVLSDHLFTGSKITSWAFDNGPLPTVLVTFSDGTAANFAYEPENNVRAWTRHDAANNIEYVASMTTGGVTISGTVGTVLPFPIFVIVDGTKRYIEFGVPRYVTPAIKDADTEWDKNESIAAMDSMVSWSHLINDDLTDDALTLTPVVADTWDGDLTLSCVDDAIFTAGGIGATGTVFRFFDSDGASFDLEVTARANDNSVTVSPDITFPSASASDPRLYEAKAVFTGLDHMDDESVSIVSDGFVLASPNNSIENYTVITVSSGSITLPDSKKGAFVHIGRPFVSDVGTLDIETVEQRPVLIESKTVNKLFIKIHNTRGFYLASRFPPNDTLSGLSSADPSLVNMAKLKDLAVDYDVVEPITGNRFDQSVTKRVEATLPGDWKSKGRIAIRNVDPIHFEILSIIPDLTDLKRFDREGGED